MTGLELIASLRAQNAAHELSRAANAGMRRVILAAWRVQTCTPGGDDALDIFLAIRWLENMAAQQPGQPCPDPSPVDVLTPGEVADWEQAAAHLVNLAGA